MVKSIILVTVYLDTVDIKNCRTTMVNRCCADCHRSLHKDSYTETQWYKGVGVSRCRVCLGHETALDASQTARMNNSHRATFKTYNLKNPFASGAFRLVAKGKYTQGDRSGETCVCKWFKTGGVLESHFYDTDIAASEEAMRLITSWNSKNLIDRMVKINLPEVWVFKESSLWPGRKVLQEPYIENYQKFNSNTGWSDDSLAWPRVMQALSHFTYHVSNGKRLLCDLQGGVYSNGVVLTDPVVMSTARQYGPTDLGPDGISTFFAHHECNEYCRSEWRKPWNRKSYYSKTVGTTMEHVPTRHSRVPLSRPY